MKQSRHDRLFAHWSVPSTWSSWAGGRSSCALGLRCDAKDAKRGPRVSENSRLLTREIRAPLATRPSVSHIPVS
jgi:hypothetical protein